MPVRPVSFLSVPATLVVIGSLALVLVPIVGPAQTLARDKTSTGATPSKTWISPRVQWGEPDLQGIWNFATMTPLERNVALGDKDVFTDEEAAAVARQILQDRDTALLTGGPEWWDGDTRVMKSRRTSQIVDPANGRIPPVVPAAAKRAAARDEARRGRGPADSFEDRSLEERCLSRGSAGPPIVPGPYNNNVRLIQTRDYVVIFNEMIHDARVVPMNGRPHGHVRQWMGESRGHWEGETLVIDTINFTDKTRFRGSSENLHLTERLTRVDANTINYQYTADDPMTWTRPWTAAFPLKKTNSPIYEYACHEGNYLTMVGTLKGARAQESGAATPETR